jgi:formate hydrogenlyase subunit 3/multisubunit Na+/H+ antiporter MnhD subunit
MAQIKKDSAVKKALATFFLSVSTAYIRAKRITDGIALQYAVRPRPLLALAWAMLTAALLYPLHRWSPQAHKPIL